MTPAQRLAWLETREQFLAAELQRLLRERLANQAEATSIRLLMTHFDFAEYQAMQAEMRVVP